MNNKCTNLLQDFYMSCEMGIRHSKSVKARRALESRGLSLNNIQVGYNSGQFFRKKGEEVKAIAKELGLLSSNPNSVAGKKEGETCFGKEGLIFPLRNELDDIVNLFSYRFNLDTPMESFLNGEGLFPEFPSRETKRLFITEDIFDAGILLESGVLSYEESVIALNYEELCEQHLFAIEERQWINEIVFICPDVESKISQIQEIRKDLNFIDGYNEDISLLEMYENHSKSEFRAFLEDKIQNSEAFDRFTIHSDKHFEYKGILGVYEMFGALTMDTSSMKINARLTINKKSRPVTVIADPYKHQYFDQDIERICEEAEEDIESFDLKNDIKDFGRCLEQFRIERIKGKQSKLKNFKQQEYTTKNQKESIDFLSRANLLKRIDKLIEESGFVGEEKSRLTTFVIASSYKTSYSLHGLVKGTSGGGKSHLINGISGMMPQEDVVDFTNISDKAFNHFKSDELVDKLVVIQDIDGIGKKALLSLRELQSNKKIVSSSPIKDEYGELETQTKVVYGDFASLIATTHNKVYFDNEDRSVILGIDESNRQTKRVIKRQQQISAGLINERKEEQAQFVLRNLVRTIKNYKVVNPFALDIMLPLDIIGLRRFNKQFNDFISQITLLNQFQREIQGDKVFSTLEDVRLAIDLFFEPLVLKVDELDPSTRQFYEVLKVYSKNKVKSKKDKITATILRKHFNKSHSHINEHLKALAKYKCIEIIGGSKNKGFEYKVIEDEHKELRERIKSDLIKQVEKVEQKQLESTKVA